MTTTSATKPCPKCETLMEFVPAHVDGEDADGRRGVYVPDAHVCGDCWFVELESGPPEASDAIPGVDP